MSHYFPDAQAKRLVSHSPECSKEAQASARSQVHCSDNKPVSFRVTDETKGSRASQVKAAGHEQVRVHISFKDNMIHMLFQKLVIGHLI